MIKINKITETTCKLYNPEDECIGVISTGLELADVRIQIKEEAVEGYYVTWKEGTIESVRILIDKFGYLSVWPVGFFDECDIQLETLLGWRL